MDIDKLQWLLNIVIEKYIKKWEPIWSKFLNSLKSIDYAPSTLRKYLNLLEKEGFLYQPYNSSGRLPTMKWLELYVDWMVDEETSDFSEVKFNFDSARNWMKFIVESLWNYIDWAAVGFIQDDEYYYLWINNLMKEKYSWEDFDYIKYLVDFIEHKKIITFLNRNQIQKNQVYYTFISDNDNVVSSIHTKINVNWFDWIVSILWPMRMNYEKNIWVLKKLLKSYNKACC